MKKSTNGKANCKANTEVLDSKTSPYMINYKRILQKYQESAIITISTTDTETIYLASEQKAIVQMSEERPNIKSGVYYTYKSYQIS